MHFGGRMKDSIIIGLLQNIGILLVFSMLYESFWLKKKENHKLATQLGTGMFLGGITVILMYTPWTLLPGVTFDTRSVVLSISGLFFGPVPTIMAMIISAIVRLTMGGAGLWMGIAVIFSSGAIGICWRKLRDIPTPKRAHLDLFILGLVVHLTMLACTALLPASIRYEIVKTIGLPLILIYSPGTMLLGLLLLKQQKNHQIQKEKERLTESDLRLRQILHSGRIAFLELDPVGYISFCNDHFLELIKYTREEIIGTDWVALMIPPHYHEEARKRVKIFLDSKDVKLNTEFPLIDKEGNPCYIQWNHAIISDDNSDFKGIACVGIDISRRKMGELKLSETNQKIESQNAEYKQLNEELNVAMRRAEESDKLKSAFLANLSHEIRTPMNAIMGFSELLKEDDLEEYEQANYLDIIEERGTHLLSIIEDIIEMSKIETGQITPRYSGIKLSSFLTGINQAMAVTIPKEKDLTLQISLAPSVKNLTLQTDPVKLGQVLNNLIGNAIKFSPDGKIRWGADQTPSGDIHLYVQDEGIGIAPAYHDRIFDRFHRVESDLNINNGGSGLGLSISKAYIEMMNGKIRLDSEPGKGTTFHIELPYLEVFEKQKTMPLQIAQMEKKYFPKGLILIAEDDDNNFAYFESILKRSNYNFIRAINGHEAIEHCESNKSIEMILMDIKMPVMDGYEATRELRKRGYTLPIIAQTAYNLRTESKIIRENGFDDSIAKPVKAAELIAMIQRFTSSDKFPSKS